MSSSTTPAAVAKSTTSHGGARTFDFSPASIAASASRGGASPSVAMSPTGGLSSKAGSVASSNAAAPPKALRSPLPANAAVLPDMDSIPENRVSHYSYSVASSTLSISELQPPKAVSKKLIRCHQRKSEYIDPESAFGLRTRRRLRNDPEILMRLLLYWETCYRHPVTQQVPRQEYIELHVRISKALISPFKYSEALELAVEEWNQDTGGAESMTEEQFLLALFATVDLWTDCVHCECYVWFLDMLYDCLTVPRSVASRVAMEQASRSGASNPLQTMASSKSLTSPTSASATAALSAAASGSVSGSSSSSILSPNRLDPTAGGAERQWRNLADIPENSLQTMSAGSVVSARKIGSPTHQVSKATEWAPPSDAGATVTSNIPADSVGRGWQADEPESSTSGGATSASAGSTYKPYVFSTDTEDAGTGETKTGKKKKKKHALDFGSSDDEPAADGNGTFQLGFSATDAGLVQSTEPAAASTHPSGLSTGLPYGTRLPDTAWAVTAFHEWRRKRQAENEERRRRRGVPLPIIAPPEAPPVHALPSVAYTQSLLADPFRRAANPQQRRLIAASLGQSNSGAFTPVSAAPEHQMSPEVSIHGQLSPGNSRSTFVAALLAESEAADAVQKPTENSNVRPQSVESSLTGSRPVTSMMGSRPGTGLRDAHGFVASEDFLFNQQEQGQSSAVEPPITIYEASEAIWSDSGSSAEQSEFFRRSSMDFSSGTPLASIARMTSGLGATSSRSPHISPSHQYSITPPPVGSPFKAYHSTMSPHADDEDILSGVLTTFPAFSSRSSKSRPVSSNTTLSKPVSLLPSLPSAQSSAEASIPEDSPSVSPVPPGALEPAAPTPLTDSQVVASFFAALLAAAAANEANLEEWLKVNDEQIRSAWRALGDTRSAVSGPLPTSKAASAAPSRARSANMTASQPVYAHTFDAAMADVITYGGADDQDPSRVDRRLLFHDTQGRLKLPSRLREYLTQHLGSGAAHMIPAAAFENATAAAFAGRAPPVEAQLAVGVGDSTTTPGLWTLSLLPESASGLQALAMEQQAARLTRPEPSMTDVNAVTTTALAALSLRPAQGNGAGSGHIAPAPGRNRTPARPHMVPAAIVSSPSSPTVEQDFDVRGSNEKFASLPGRRSPQPRAHEGASLSSSASSPLLNLPQRDAQGHMLFPRPNSRTTIHDVAAFSVSGRQLASRVTTPQIAPRIVSRPPSSPSAPSPSYATESQNMPRSRSQGALMLMPRSGNSTAPTTRPSSKVKLSLSAAAAAQSTIAAISATISSPSTTLKSSASASSIHAAHHRPPPNPIFEQFHGPPPNGYFSAAPNTPWRAPRGADGFQTAPDRAYAERLMPMPRSLGFVPILSPQNQAKQTSVPQQFSQSSVVGSPMARGRTALGSSASASNLQRLSAAVPSLAVTEAQPQTLTAKAGPWRYYEPDRPNMALSNIESPAYKAPAPLSPGRSAGGVEIGGPLAMTRPPPGSSGETIASPSAKYPLLGEQRVVVRLQEPDKFPPRSPLPSPEALARLTLVPRHEMA